MIFKLGDKVSQKSNGTNMVIMEVLNELTNPVLIDIGFLKGFVINDYICSWIYKDKKESDYFKEHELEFQ